MTEVQEGAAVEAAPSPEFQTSTTPSGLEVYYQWEPKRLYRVRFAPLLTAEVPDDHREDDESFDWVEVPSVTTVLDILSKGGGLVNWGQGTGIHGVLELYRRGILFPLVNQENQAVLGIQVAGVWQEATDDDVVSLLKANELTIDDNLEAASKRGNNVHKRALETWAEHRVLPVPQVFPQEERGYATGLLRFLEAIDPVADQVASERMVGSLEHLFAGRFDLELVLDEPVDVVSRIFPKKPPKMGVMQPGRWRLDLKTSKHVYESHFLQLEGYEGAAIECGYETSDYRAVIHVTADGRYELVESPAVFEDFLAVREAYDVVQRLKGWKTRKAS